MRRFGLTVLLLAVALPLWGQSNNRGSIYSRFGLGELQSFSSSKSHAMGGAGLALSSVNFLNMANPAAWGDNILTRFTAGFQLQNLRAEDNLSANTSQSMSGTLSTVHLGFPLKFNRLGLSLGFTPLTRIGYHVLEQRTLPASNEIPTVNYTNEFEGDGGVQMLNLGLGWKINEYVSVGGNVDVYFGLLEYRQKTEFADASYLSTNLQTNTRLWGISGTLGTLFRLPVGTGNQLSLGTTFHLPATLNGERTRIFGETLDRDTLGTVQSGEVGLPARTAIGLGYTTDRWEFAVDAQIEGWSSLTSDFALGSIGGNNTSLSDRLRIGGGMQFRPGGTQRFGEVSARQIAYRLGAYYDQGYYDLNTNVDITTYAITGGLSLPTGFAGAFIDVNLEFGRRGTLAENLVRDLFYKVSLTINFGERWFVKTKLR